jgi:hypothetical protein
MIEHEDIKLAWSEWIMALQDLSICCADSEPHHASAYIREVNALLRLAPAGTPLAGLRPLRPARLTALLELDADESAVLAMLDRGAGFLLSRGGDGRSLATIVLPGHVVEQSASGATPALALVGALALALCEGGAGSRIARLRGSTAPRPALH